MKICYCHYTTIYNSGHSYTSTMWLFSIYESVRHSVCNVPPQGPLHYRFVAMIHIWRYFRLVLIIFSYSDRYQFLYARFKNGRIMPSVVQIHSEGGVNRAPKQRHFCLFFVHILKCQFETWYVLVVGSVTHWIRVPSQSGHSDLP